MDRWCIAASLVLALGACDSGAAPVDSGPAPVDSGLAADAGIPEDLDGYAEHWMACGGILGSAIALVTPTGISLEILASRSRFRTWAWTRHIYTPGQWNVVVRTADGQARGAPGVRGAPHPPCLGAERGCPSVPESP